MADGSPTLEYRKGEVIGGRYTTLGILGSGGFGVVYHVRDKNDGRELALKTFRDEYILNPEVKRQFGKEALTWIEIGRHEFVLHAERVHEFNDRLFVAMEYIRPDENGLVTLFDHIAFHGPRLSNRLIGTWAIEFCHGMGHAYANGVKAHRDVKPQNILIGDGAFIKISDFGLAASINHAEVTSTILESVGLSSFHVQGKTLCGTTGYIAPELLIGGTASYQSDIYSFGAVLWQLCTGSTVPPFWKTLTGLRNPAATHEMLRKLPIPQLQNVFGEVIYRCMRPYPTDRYRSFDEIRDAIKEAIRRSGDRPLDFVVNTAASFADLVDRGASLRALGQFSKALACYDAAIDLEPADARVWVNKGNVLSSMRRRADALAAYNRAAQIDPKCELAWFNEGLELQRDEDHAQAIQCFEMVLELNPKSGAAHRRKGQSLVARKAFQEAKICYLKALEADPTDDFACCYLGELLNLVGSKSEALVWYDRAIKANAKTSVGWIGKAEVLMDLSRFDDAIGCLDVALRLNPADFSSLNLKAVALCRSGRQREAIPMFDILLQGDGTDLDVIWTNKGNALSELGSWREALECYECAIAENPNYAPAQRRRQWVINQLQEHGD
jgi:tetratricopeptide (TPR) repeat protein